jgi:hypothetical protein
MADKPKLPLGSGPRGFYDDYCKKCVDQKYNGISSSYEWDLLLLWRQRGKNWKCPIGLVTPNKRIPPEDCPYALEVIVGHRLDKDECKNCNMPDWNEESDDIWEQGMVYCKAVGKHISVNQRRPEGCVSK